MFEGMDYCFVETVNVSGGFAPAGCVVNDPVDAVDADAYAASGSGEKGKVKLSDRALRNKRVYDKDYAKKYLKGKSITFNTLYPEDIALLEWVKKQGEGGNQYIKRLIREDMERRQACA